MNDKEHDDNVDRPRLVSDPPGSDDAAVARLLRLAGHRPEVPAVDAAAVKQAARAEWRRAVQAERRRAYFYRGAGGLLAAAAVTLLVVGSELMLNTDQLRSGPPDSREPVATVEVVTGQVWAVVGTRTPDHLAPVRPLFSDTVVETAPDTAGDAPSRVAIRLAGGWSIRLNFGTRVRVLSGHQLALERGAVYADSGLDAAGPDTGPGLEIQTSLGLVRDIGTQFEVRLDDAASVLEVRVREGEVILDRDAGEPLTVHAGFAAKSDGSVPTEVPCHGEDWEWILKVLPPFDAEGRTLMELLEWATRESCWQPRFADPAHAALGPTNYLSGSIAGLTPEEAVAGFLMGSGLSYRLEDGVLSIEPAAGL